MQLDFWNNPIVVSAFRVKYRRGGLMMITCLYVMALAVGGSLLHYYSPLLFPQNGPVSWARFYFLVLLALQFVVSGLIAGITTSSSIRAEVANRTLDFQRIAALSPRQILLGKLLGEPALGFLLAIAILPLLVFACLFGGGRLDELALMYVNLFAFTILQGATGLINKLDPPGGKGQRSGAGAGAVVVWMVLMPQLLIHGRTAMAREWTAVPIGLLTPIPSFLGMWEDRVGSDASILSYCLPFFDLRLPYVFMAPLFQLLLAWICFEIMARRLVNPLNPPLSKLHAYGLLLGVDVLAAGVLYTVPTGILSLEGRSAAFCLVHLLLGFWPLLSLTPKRDTLVSWVWRFRGRGNRFRDLLLGDRSENSVMVLAFCALGALSLLLLVRLPAYLQTLSDPAESAAFQASWTVTWWALAVVTVLAITIGTCTQVCEVLLPRSGGAVLMMLVLMTIAFHILGQTYPNQFSFLLSFSPSAVFAPWFVRPHPEVNPVPLLTTCIGLTTLAWVWLRRWKRRTQEEVDRKLRDMGALPAVARG